MKVLLIDGIGDYSIIRNQYRKNSPDYFILTISQVLKQYATVLYLDLREKQFEKSKIHEKIREFMPDFTFIKCTSLNIMNIRNLQFEQLKLGKTFLISSDNDYNIDDIGEKIINFNTIVLNNKTNIESNLNKIFEVIRPKIVSDCIQMDKVMPWSTITNFENKSILLNSGYGCNRKCSFCHIRNSKCCYIAIDKIFNEIDYLFSKGIRYFHLNNHNISYNIDFITLFCTTLISKYNNKFDFIWSCSLIPEEIAIAPNIINLLKKSKCEIVELNAFSINNAVLNSLQITQNKEDILKLITELYNSGISSIVVNYIIGFPEETQQSLMELIEFSEILVNSAPGIVEFNLANFENSFEMLNDLKSNIDHRSAFQLSKDQFYAFRSFFYSHISKKMGKSIYKMSIKQRIAHCELYTKNIRTQYFVYFISKCSTYGVYNITQTVVAYKHSWEIHDDILNYCPFCHVLPLPNKEKLTLNFDPQFVNPEIGMANNLELNGIEETLFNLSKEYISLSEIITQIEREHNINYQNASELVLSFYNKLESLDLILYTKVL